MFVLANLIDALAYVLNTAFWVLEWAIIIHVVLFWVNADRFNPIVRLVGMVSEPFLKPIRRILPPWRLNGLDLSPAVAVIGLVALQKFLIPTLWEWAARLR
jgi:YggT family protein